MVSGDADMVALDDGTNTDYSTNGSGFLPRLHSAAVDRPGTNVGRVLDGRNHGGRPMTSEPTRQEHDAMTTLDRNRTTFSEPSEPSEPKDDEIPDDKLSVVDVLKRSFRSGHTAAGFVIYGSSVFVALLVAAGLTDLRDISGRTR